MSYPSQNPRGPHYPRQQTYEPDPAAFHSTAYPSTSSAYPADPTARFGVPTGAGSAWSTVPSAPAAGMAGGDGVHRRQTVRGAQRGTTRDVGLNPRLSMAPQRGLTRGKTLTRPDRFVAPAPLIAPSGVGRQGKQGGNVQTKLVDGVPTLVTREPWWQPWSLFVEVVTFWAPRPLLRKFGMTDPTKQRAWKEKCALCEISLFMMGIIGFITMGLQRTLCPQSGERSEGYFQRLGSTPGYIGIEGWNMQVSGSTPSSLSGPANDFGGTDLTSLFDRSDDSFPSCNGIDRPYATVGLCTSSDQGIATSCTLKRPTAEYLSSLGLQNTTKQVGYDWNQLGNLTNYIVNNGAVLNLTPYMNAFPNALSNDTVDALLRQAINSTAGSSRDLTRAFQNTDELKQAAACIHQRYYAGHIDKVTPGCFVANLFLYVSLILIMGIVLARFFMALVFSWYLADRMVQKPRNLKRKVVSPAVLPEGANIDINNRTGAAPWVESHMKRQQTQRLRKGGGRGGKGARNAGEKALPAVGKGEKGDELPAIPREVNADGMISMATIGAELFAVCLVTCYSEGAEGIKTTLDSIAATNYSDARKLLFVVCDGMITGSGEKMSTPDIVVGMIERDPRFGDPLPMSYVAVADGSKAHNQAMVYAGHYTQVAGHRTPIIVVVKCGTPAEANDAKPGNRGKRDSQMVLMNFFGRVTYNDRMTPLDFDLFRKTQSLMGVTPDFFEVVLMVDADTMCYPDSLGYLVRAMQNDSMIMGVCGETRIANKRQSWVTMIQVFEYFISHHQAKAFESVFGGVTCLPGCFSMYRIKARKEDDGDWFPVLVSPSITSEYSQSVVTTLHQKNLLLLGEDRFLTTILLRSFPNRKMMFCPKARCRTVVPDTFKILLSQRRRWINSTIHNLMELVLVRNLCGTFCFSMQFVTFIDLIGTIVLPIAICLTYALIINTIISPPTQFGDAIPLVLLVGVLGLPGILVILSTLKFVYVGWMLIYLIALPIWNMVLPLYAFSKFDDFSWGETRRVAGATKADDDHGASSGVSAASAVPLRRWEDWEKSRLRKIRRDEKRRREFERQFGSRAVHGQQSLRDGASTYADSETASSYGGPDEDRWGAQIGAYNEDLSGNIPPPVGLYSLDEIDDDDETLAQHDLVNVLEGGWDDASPIGSPSPSSTPFGHRSMTSNSGYSTPIDQPYGQQPYPPSYGHGSAHAAPQRGWTLTDGPPMSKSYSSQSHSQLPLNASTASLSSSSGNGHGASPPVSPNPFDDANRPPPLISPLATAAALGHETSYASLASSTASSTGVSPSSHARRRSLTSSPEARRNGGGLSPLIGEDPLGGASSPSPTRGAYDWQDQSGGGRRLV
ncbi:uncharacterized protein JCM10292_001612 [Rhodotorula paludigena]|uniref:uncharacterized protein n=1 Tax=Rhodotorula paludigena TaxID=86838 RepID=UPI00317210AD